MLTDNTMGHSTNVNITENPPHSLGTYSFDQRDSTNAFSSHQRLGRSNSLDFGVDPASLPPLGDTKKIRPPLLPHRPRAPPDYDTVSRAKKKAASAYNLSHTDASDDFFVGGEGSAFGAFRSSEFLFGGADSGNNTNAMTSSSSTQTKYHTMESSSKGGGTSGIDVGYHTMDSNTRSGTGLNYGDLNNSYGFETGAGGSRAETSSTEKSFSSSVYGTSIGTGLNSNGLANGGLTNGSGI